MRNILLSLFTCLLCCGSILANNIEITNVQLADEVQANPNSSSYPYALSITFDLSWDNSWRLNAGPTNFDAAYVFAYYRTNGGDWTFLGNGVNIAEDGFVQVGFAGTGVIIYPNSNNIGSGDVALTSWRYNGLISDLAFDPNAEIEVRMFAVEMVWVPGGEFFVGDANGLANSFNNGLSGAQRAPFQITSENFLSVGGQGQLNITQTSSSAGLNSGTISSEYPKGHEGFWTMKYEVSQQQYVDFFNTLTDFQKTQFDVTGPNGKNTDGVINRNGCTWPGTDDMATTLPNVAMNYVSPSIMYAYLDWAHMAPYDGT